MFDCAPQGTSSGRRRHRRRRDRPRRSRGAPCSAGSARGRAGARHGGRRYFATWRPGCWPRSPRRPPPRSRCSSWGSRARASIRAFVSRAVRRGRASRCRLHAVRDAARRPRRATRPRRSSASSSCDSALASASSACDRARRAALEPGLAPALRLALDVPDDHAIDPRGPDRRPCASRSSAPAARSARVRGSAAVATTGGRVQRRDPRATARSWRHRRS